MRLTGADGRLLSTVTGWHDRRFAGGPQTGAVHRFAGLNILAEQRSEGWHLLVEPWPDIASREFHLRKYLSGPERAAYRRLTPTAQRSWLLRRVVVKDAVRDWLWDHGHGPLFPAEIEVLGEGPGRQCHVRGRHGLRLPALDVAADADRGDRRGAGSGGQPDRTARIRVEEGSVPTRPRTAPKSVPSPAPAAVSTPSAGTPGGDHDRRPHGPIPSDAQVLDDLRAIIRRFSRWSPTRTSPSNPTPRSPMIWAWRASIW